MTYKKILFVCLGNSCSSPMAESIMQNLMIKTSIYWEVDSAALRSWNTGRRPHSRCLRVLRDHGLRSDHYTRMFTLEDFHQNDYIVAMDNQVYKELLLWAGLTRNVKHCQIVMLAWYGENGQPTLINDLSPTKSLKTFRNAYYQIKECCKQFILNQQISIVQYDMPSTEDEEYNCGSMDTTLCQLTEEEPPKPAKPTKHFKKKSKPKKLCKKCLHKFVKSL